MWKVVVLGGLVVAWGWAVLGGAFYAEGFRTTGRGYGDWYWLSAQAHAQWEFFTLPASPDPYVALEAFLCLSQSNGSSPAEIEVRFQVTTTAGCGYRTYVARLNRVQANHESVLYFGQVFLARRDVGLGSRLTVRLDGAQSKLPLGVHSGSVRVSGGLGGAPAPGLVAATEEAGRGGSLDEVSGILGPTGGSVGNPQTVRSLPDSEHAETAPFLAPGVYRGELGWPGPYQPMDGKDLYRVNLRPGQIVTVRLEASSGCTLYLLDPTGRKVGEVEGSSWLGLEYRADVAGAWQVLIVCREGGPRFPYTLTLQIK
ncbi:MAG: hypothetical protein ABID40_02045 [Candidatus Bipolaricaulota bacterium]